jgi:formate dehydrogenase maturation protein FdhE
MVVRMAHYCENCGETENVEDVEVRNSTVRLKRCCDCGSYVRGGDEVEKI